MTQEPKSRRKSNKIIIICAAVILIATIVACTSLEIATPSLKIGNVQIQYTGDSSSGQRNYNAIITVNNLGLPNVACIVQFYWTKGNSTFGYYECDQESVNITNNTVQVVTIPFQMNQNIIGSAAGTASVLVNGQIIAAQNKTFV